MWPFKAAEKPVKANTTEDLLRDLKLLRKRYGVHLSVHDKWTNVVSNADFGTAAQVISTTLAILEVQVARSAL